MATPNAAYQPRWPAINQSPVYLDGWETTLTTEWDGNSALPVADWIGLDVFLKNNDAAHAMLTLETPASAPVRYRKMLQIYGDGDAVMADDYGNLATDAPPDEFLWPAGSRLYMSVSALDLQRVFNNQLTVMSYYVVDGHWEGVDSYSTVVNPDGTPYEFPPVGNNTGLILLTYWKAYGPRLLLSATLLSLPGTWCTSSHRD